MPGLSWRRAASPDPATHTFCSRQNKQFGGAGKGCYARRGKTAGGPRSPPSLPLPGVCGSPGEGAGGPRGGGEGRARPGEDGGGQGRAQHRSGGAGSAAPPAAGKGPGLQPGGQQRHTGAEGRKKGCCTTEGAGALGRAGQGSGRRTARSLCILRQKLS